MLILENPARLTRSSCKLLNYPDNFALTQKHVIVAAVGDRQFLSDFLSLYFEINDKIVKY
jgi:hypothetical protein